MGYLLQIVLLFFSFDLYGENEIGSPTDIDWPSNNYTLNGQRFVPVDQINKSNAVELERVCSLSVVESGTFQTNILHVDGLLYFTTPFESFAVDSSSCEVVWKHDHRKHFPMSSTAEVNQGMAYANGRIFRGTPDGWLLALNAKSGKPIWEHQTGDPLAGESFNGAPQTFQGLVIIGAGNGNKGVSGRVMAYEAATGREVWRYTLTPRKESGGDSSTQGGTAFIGGGISGSTYTIDVGTAEVFIPVGKPAPDLLVSERTEETQFPGGLVVLDANTGLQKWRYPLGQDEGHKLDISAAPVLYYSKDGQRMVGFGSRDGYVYGLDRDSFELKFKMPITRVSDTRAVPTLEGSEVCPGPFGGIAWNGPAFDRENRILITGAVDWCTILKPSSAPDSESQTLLADSIFGLPGTGSGWMLALDADSGEVLWNRKTNGPQVAAITPTSGGVAFSGDMSGNFQVVDSRTGKILFGEKVDGGLAGGVVTYMRKGRQLVAFVSGGISNSTFGHAGKPTLHVYGLPGIESREESKVTRDMAEEMGL